MSNRDYTKRSIPYKNDVLILKAEASQVARAAIKEMIESGDSKLMTELLVSEYYGNKPLYKKHRTKYVQ